MTQLAERMEVTEEVMSRERFAAILRARILSLQPGDRVRFRNWQDVEEGKDVTWPAEVVESRGGILRLKVYYPNAVDEVESASYAAHAWPDSWCFED